MTKIPNEHLVILFELRRIICMLRKDYKRLRKEPGGKKKKKKVVDKAIKTKKVKGTRVKLNSNKNCF